MRKLFGISTTILNLEFVIWWLFLTLFQTYTLISLGFTWCVSILDSVVFNTLLVASGYAIRLVVRYYLTSFQNRYYPFIAGFSLAALSVYLETYLLQCLIPEEKILLQMLENGVLIRFAFALLIIEFQMVMQWIGNNIKAQEEETKRRTETESMVREAELSKLRLQLQPHFLFNSLNSISALVGSRPEEARNMIQQLSDFLRGTLKKDDQKMVSLEEELKHLNLYLEIEKVRFGHRLQTGIECSDEAKVLLIPSLLLQPIVENAIKFGLYDTIGDITIRIKAETVGNILQVSVSNPFDGSTSKASSGTGFGLNSIQRRLHLLFARTDLLSVIQNEHTFTTVVKIPQNHV